MDERTRNHRSEQSPSLGGGLSRIVRQSGLYALGNIAVKASGLLLAPLYLNTDLLPTEAYGQLILLEATAQIVIPVAGLGVSTGMLRFMALPEEQRYRDVLPFTTLLLSTALALWAFLLFWVAAPVLATLLLDDPDQAVLPRLLAGYVALKVIGTVPYTLLRTEERAGWYALALSAEWAFLVGGVYYFLALQEAGLIGVLWAYLLASGVSTLLLCAGMLVRVPWRFRPDLMVQLVLFGAPLVLSSLSSIFLNVGDRYLLKWLTDAETVAMYGWGARLGGVINMLFVQSLQLAFTVIGLKSVGVGDLSIHRRTFRHYTIWTGWAVLGLSLLAFDLTAFLVEQLGADPYYLRSIPLVLPVAIGFMAYGAYVVINNILYAVEKTRVIGINVMLAALTNVALNLMLIPFLGAMGAALATTFAYIMLVLLSARVAERQIRIGYPWRVAILVLMLVLGLYAVGQLTTPWPVHWRLFSRFGLILIYFPLLLVFRLYTRDDLRQGRRFLQEKWRSAF